MKKYKLSYKKIFTILTNSENSPVLTFNGEKYNINTLPEKVKDLLKAAKVADNQIKIQEDNLKLITIARQTIAAQLQKELDSVDTIS